MLEDPARARVALSGDEFIFDVQTHVSDPLTPFERKYAASGHTLHRLEVDLR